MPVLVVYTGLHQTPEEIVHAAIQEDVKIDCPLQGSCIFSAGSELLREGSGRCGWIGGASSDDDITTRRRIEIFTPGSNWKGLFNG
jgi:methylmalonyl-CoA mutase C-terminal domain/subunit